MAKVRLPKSKEESVAEKIADLVTDLRLDLEQVGIYVARQENTTYRRVQIIAESAKYEREEPDLDVCG
jgi:hypothetical protein